MDNAYTISAHFGKKMSRDHNIRNRNITNSEDHIDPDGYFKIIEDRPIKQAYYKIFGQAVLDYNAKQTRSDRQIIDYHTKVLSAYKRDPNRNPATSHEAIFTIGNVNHHPTIVESEKILTNFLDQFKKNNPNAIVFGAYFHADEPGSAPHLHVDFILVKRQNKRGLSIQVSQEGALKEMGYYTTGSKKNKDLVTAQTRWQAAQRELLRTTARNHGLQVQESGKSKTIANHLDTEIYKRTTKLKNLDQKIEEKKMWAENAKSEAEKNKKELSEILRTKQELDIEIQMKKANLEEITKIKKKNKELSEENTFLKKSINILQESIDLAESFFKTYFLKNKENLWNIFKQKLSETFGSKKYERYNIIRHDTELNEKLAQHERDYLEGERRDPPPTQLFGYDAKTDNESDFHCEELTIENENL